MIVADQKVKVLDFGLAKAFAGDGADANLSQSPTLSMAATQQGVILGTAAYMSPEQASGAATDKRADIWAFGVVLFEMVTGRQLFTGKTASHVMGAVLNIEPDWNSLPANLHPRVRMLLERSLEKEAKDRLSGISDARVDIQKVLSDPDGVIVQPVAEVVQAAPQAKLPLVATFVLTAIAVGVAVWILRTPEPGPISRFSLLLPEGQRFSNLKNQAVALSPDGSKIVYMANQQLHLRSIDTLESTPIPGTAELPRKPFFSPDGEWIGFYSVADQQLKKIALGGGAPVTLTDAVNSSGTPHWESDDTVVFNQPEGVRRVSANGGTPDLLLAGEGLSSPQLLPGGQAVLFSVDGDIAVQSLNSDEPKVLFPGAFPTYVSTGHIVYTVVEVLFAVPFDLGTLELTGGPVSLIEGLQTSSQYAVSDSGSLVYMPGGDVGQRRTLVMVERNGDTEPIETIPPGEYAAPRLSPNGERVLLMDSGDVWVYEIDSGRRSAVTTDSLAGNEAEWDPTGTQVAYSSNRAGSGSMNVFVQPVDSSGNAEQLTNVEGTLEVDSWSPDGQVLAAHHHNLDGEINILMIPVGGSATSETQGFLEREFAEEATVFSPDGLYVAYSSNESGETEIYIRPYPGPGSQTTVSVGGGTEPVWAANGELFYRSVDRGRMMAVSVTTDPMLDVGDIVEVFNGPYFGNSPRPDYDVTTDGLRFLMLTVGDALGRGQIVFVQNWFQELKERVPVP